MRTGRKPEGLTGLRKRVSGAAAWAGGTHVADSRVSPYGQTGLGQRVLEDISGVLVSFKREVWWVGRRKTGKAERRTRRWWSSESRESSVSDHLPRRKDVTLFASVVPPFAETINLLNRVTWLEPEYLNGSTSRSLNCTEALFLLPPFPWLEGWG